MTFHFSPQRVRADLRDLCIRLHYWLLEKQRHASAQNSHKSIRHIEGERSDDWQDRTG